MSIAAAALEAMINVVMRYWREDGSKWQTTDECVTARPVSVFQGLVTASHLGGTASLVTVLCVVLTT